MEVIVHRWFGVNSDLGCFSSPPTPHPRALEDQETHQANVKLDFRAALREGSCQNCSLFWLCVYNGPLDATQKVPFLPLVRGILFLFLL